MSEPADGSPGLPAKPEAPAPLPAGTPWYAQLFVQGVRDCYKWLSTWITAAAAGAPMIYDYLSDPTCIVPYHEGCMQLVVSPHLFGIIESVLVLFIFLSHIKRKGDSQ